MWYRKYRCGIGKNRCGIGKNRCGIGISDVVSVFPIFGIGIFPLRAFSDTTSEIISNRVWLQSHGFLYETYYNY
jgi:hypothetical protein